MILGIRTIVDYVFKRIFACEHDQRPLLGLLNAVLDLSDPIVSVQVINPFNNKEFEDQKAIILDVRCRDSSGRVFNVEMQVDNRIGLRTRLLYYACSMFVDQLKVGNPYESAKPAISICFLRQEMFPESRTGQRVFRMNDCDSGMELSDSLEIHIIELAKYNLKQEDLGTCTALERWVYLMLYSQDHSAEELRALLPGEAFCRAIDILEMIASKTEDKQMYDQREKALRDYEWALSGAMNEGREEGLQEGREQGREEGWREGKLEGKTEGKIEGKIEGFEVGKLAGEIQVLENLLGEPVSSDSELFSLAANFLTERRNELQARMRNR
jgi:predicted transposase/invertase (TIGR01784 family)